jgi:carbonic anhydrase
MSVVDELRSANEQYASRFDQGDLQIPPARSLAVVTCMDARLDPRQFLGLDLGDAHVIRNAGGLVSDDALRSLVISHHLLGTQEAVVIAHTGCGMLTFTNDDLHERLGPKAESVDFLPFGDLDESVRASARKIEESPLLPDSFGVTGFVYEVETGKLRPVELD